MKATTDLATAALGYAARGWPVFPCHTPTSFGPKKGEGRATCSCGKADCESQGKHPRTANGVRDASTDPELVAAWWRRWPTANIGMATGIAFDVLDLDGLDALDELNLLALDTLFLPDEPDITVPGPAGPMVLTGSGVHHYVAPTGATNRCRVGQRPGIDWRGRGGYVIAPPSIHYRWGECYEWASRGPDTPIEKAPEWLVDVIVKRPGMTAGPPAPVVLHRSDPRGSVYGNRAMEDELDRLGRAGEGHRNHELNRAAFALGQLVAGGELDATQVAAGLLNVATRIGLPEGEAIATIRSGMASGMAQPRSAGGR